MKWEMRCDVCSTLTRFVESSLRCDACDVSWLSLSRLLKIEAANAREKWAEHEDHE